MRATAKGFMLRSCSRFRLRQSRASRRSQTHTIPGPSAAESCRSTPPAIQLMCRSRSANSAIPTCNRKLPTETWSYGAVYSPKWLKGLTISADWWHIDMRSIASILGAQFIIDHENSFPGLVTRALCPGPALLNGGHITLVIDPNANLAGAVLEGLDYELIYILDTSIFGHGDFGQFTYTVNGTWVSRFELQVAPDQKPFGVLMVSFCADWVCLDQFAPA